MINYPALLPKQQEAVNVCTDGLLVHREFYLDGEMRTGKSPVARCIANNLDAFVCAMSIGNACETFVDSVNAVLPELGYKKPKRKFNAFESYGDMLLSTYQSIGKMISFIKQNKEAYAGRKVLVLFDECHSLGAIDNKTVGILSAPVIDARKLIALLKEIDCKVYILWMSGTPACENKLQYIRQLQANPNNFFSQYKTPRHAAKDGYAFIGLTKINSYDVNVYIGVANSTNINEFEYKLSLEKFKIRPNEKGQSMRGYNPYDPSRHKSILKEIKEIYHELTQDDVGIVCKPEINFHYIPLTDNQLDILNRLKNDKAIAINGKGIPYTPDQVFDGNNAGDLSDCWYSFEHVTGAKRRQVYSGSIKLTKFTDEKKETTLYLKCNKAQYIIDHIAKSGKYIIFYSHIAEGLILQKAFKAAGYNTVLGGESGCDVEFQKAGNKTVFIGQVTSNCMGLNMDTADGIIYYSLVVRITIYQQSANRATSVNRKHNIPIHILCCKGKGYNDEYKKWDDVITGKNYQEE